uniref:Apple domain-containing protein n=2 Tax=Plectus sambesii TaxID=2011161 RepID=A0A914VK19_9BILA
MVCFSKCSSFIGLHILQLILIYNLSISAAVLTYDGCKSDSANSYTVGGWCFLFYHNSSWANNIPTADGAQTVCLPHGNLAVGVTYKMLDTFRTKFTSVSIHDAWLALVRNASAGSSASGLSWKTLLPSGEYAMFPPIMSNIPWRSGEPNNNGGTENYGLVTYNGGVIDVYKDIAGYGSSSLAVICQFAPQKWTYTQRGHGRFAVPAVLIAQMNVSIVSCLYQCHISVFCISLAFNPTTSDCQIYAVSPEDPRFSGNVIADNTYEWHIRDGMEY